MLNDEVLTNVMIEEHYYEFNTQSRGDRYVKVHPLYISDKFPEILIATAN
jgi:hypothetical protein